MAFYRGMGGYVSLGGQLQGSPLVNGAVVAGATALNVKGTGGSLLGTIAVGDTFTIAGEAGSPVHTVTGGPFYLASANLIAGLNFSTAIAAGGVVDGAAMTFTSNAVAQITSWTLNATLEELDTTCMGDAWKSVIGGVASWTGQVVVRLDLLDPRQLALANKLAVSTPTGTVAALTLGTQKSATGPVLKQFYGAALLKGVQVPQQMGQIVPATFDFAGSGTLLPTWT